MLIPKSCTVNTGDGHQAYQNIEEFFYSARQEVVRIMGIDGTEPSKFNIRVENLIRKPNTPLDDSVHMLVYKDRVVALVSETRTEGNYVRFDFFANLDNLMDS